MNRTHLEHTVGALIIMGIVAFIANAIGPLWAAAAAGTLPWVWREHAQAEAKVRKEGWAKHPYFECFAPRYWSRDAVLDFVCPAVSCAAVAAVVTVFR